VENFEMFCITRCFVDSTGTQTFPVQINDNYKGFDMPGNKKGGSIIVALTSCLTGLD
jgi:hypothetical protein